MRACTPRKLPILSAPRRAFVGKSFARSLDEARFTFFSPDLPKGDLIRYQQQLAACSPVRLLDLSALNKARRWGWCQQLGQAAVWR